MLLEPGALQRRGTLDVHPPQPLGGDRLDVWLALLGSGGGAASRPRRALLRRLGFGRFAIARSSHSVALPSQARTKTTARRGRKMPAGVQAGPGILRCHITTTSRGVEGLARRNPGNPPVLGEGANSSRWSSLGDVSGSPDRTSARISQAEVFFVGRCPTKRRGLDGDVGTAVQGVRHGVSARGALRLRQLLRAARGLAMTSPPSTRRRRGARSRPDRQGSGATRTSCPSMIRPGTPRAGADAAHPRPSPGRPPRPRGGVDQERRREPHALLQGPGRRGGPGQGARAWLRDRRLRLDGQSRECRRGACRGRGPRLLRLRAGRPGGAEAARDGRLRDQAGRGARNLRRRQPAVHGALRGPALGVRQRESPALLLAGVEDARLRDRGAAGVVASGSHRLPDRLGIAVHASSPEASASGSTWAWSRASLPTFNGAQAERLQPRRHRVRRGLGRVQAATAPDDRQEPCDRRSRGRCRTRSSSPGGRRARSTR